jgi:LPXTG-site transpeptidase (sortase) family protein
VREVGLGLITAGVVVLLLVLYLLFATNLSEEQAQGRLRATFDQQVAQAQRSPTTSAASSDPSGGGATTTPSTSAGPAPSSTGTGGADPGNTSSTSASGTSGGSTGGGDNPTLQGPSPGASTPEPAGTPVAHLVIPAIGVDRYVVEGTGEAQLAEGPGHYAGTALPGQVGNVGIAGHRTTFGAPFFRLNELTVGQPIYLTATDGTTWLYKVTGQMVVDPTDTAVLDRSSTGELTLTTCNPRFSATNRLIVRAALVGTQPGGPPTGSSSTTTLAPSATSTTTVARPGPGAGPTTGHAPPPLGRASPEGVPSPELAGGGVGSWSSTIAWGVLSLDGWVLTRLGARRRGGLRKVAILLAGIAVCLLPLWFAFEGAAKLLPAGF